MSNLSEQVSTLVNSIKSLEAELAQKRAELKALTGELRDQLKQVQSLSGQRVIGTGVRAGRPKGSAVPDGELSVSQQVLNYLAAQENGATRADILTNVPEPGKERRDSAVHAAIRVHQQGGKVFNRDHRWFYNSVPRVEEPQVELPVAVQA